jgi:AraC-like DNA-binding protein
MAPSDSPVDMTPSENIILPWIVAPALNPLKLPGPGRGRALQASSSRPASIQGLRDFQAAFFRDVEPIHQLLALFDYLPDVDSFAKDIEGRFTAVSRRILERAGLTREEDLLGKSDDTIHPPNVAKAIREDDLQVIRTRQPLVDRVEALFARTRAKDWYLTTKVPLFGAQGKVVGIMGFVRPYRGTASTADPQIDRVITNIQEGFRERLLVTELARMANLSERQLNRRFQEIFRTGVHEFIIRTRVQAASDALLETDHSIAEIALNCGFSDQSSFTRHFRKHIGETPLAFRRSRSRPRSLD